MDEKHFDKVFYFICGAVLLVILFDFLVIFVPVPNGGQKYADILVGSLNTGLLMGATQYLLGGSPKGKDGQVPVTGDNPQVNVSNSN